jgi:hypothetical protein
METQYFTHDYNARRDIKMIRLRTGMGHEGVGIYWSLIEFLYENDNHCLIDDLPAIADELHTDVEKLTNLINNYDLFATEEGVFFSPSIAQRLDKRRDISDKRSTAVSRRKDRQTPNDEGVCKSVVGQSEDACKEVVKDSESSSKGVVEGSEDVCKEVEGQSGEVCKEFVEHLKDGCNDFVGENKKEKEKDNSPLPPKGARSQNRVRTFSFERETPPSWIASEMVDAFHDWIEYKRKRRSAYADENSARRCYESLMKASGGNAEAAKQRINTAITNNWQGVVFNDEAKKGAQGGGVVQNNMIINNNPNYKTW